MPDPIGQITLKTLRDQIKTEARISGSSDLDQFTTDVINELLLEFSLNARYFEFLRLNTPLTLTELASFYSLPVDFAVEKSVRYQDTATSSIWPIAKRNEYVDNPRAGRTRYYDISGSVINIYPSDQVRAGDSILLDYYVFPTRLEADEDLFPVVRLIGPVKHRAIYRLKLYNNDLQGASASKADGQEQEVRSTRISDKS